MIIPIQRLREGAAASAAAIFPSVLVIKTGDELETLADQFNDMAERLESYSDLEKKVDLRTHELSEALEQQTATSEILQVISNSLNDTQPVFDAIVQSGLKLFPGALVSVALRTGTINARRSPRRNLLASKRGGAQFPVPLARNYMHGAALLDRRIVDIPDVGCPGRNLSPGDETS
jgi:hypothetical protein